MRRQTPGKREKNKKVNRMTLKELKNKVELLEISNDDSAYLKHLKGAIGTYYFRRG